MHSCDLTNNVCRVQFQISLLETSSEFLGLATNVTINYLFSLFTVDGRVSVRISRQGWDLCLC